MRASPELPRSQNSTRSTTGGASRASPTPRPLELLGPLRSCLSCLSVAIQLLNCPRRNGRLLCSNRSVGCALGRPLLGLGPLCSACTLGVWGGLGGRVG